ncbi:hypothetical protein [Qipengyuania sp.]|uniref:hypothetical protein n=1 Tax=Qipengyuania sp. TaxID=2004515 RepID=UPI0035C7E1EB
MARPGHRPLSTYSVFGVFVALWAAALFGLVVFVLPEAVLSRAISAIGLSYLVDDRGLNPSTVKIAASALAAIIGGALGLLAVRLAARRHRYDPRPIYAGDEAAAPVIEAEEPEPVRRPLRIHEELSEEMGGSEVLPAMSAFRPQTPDQSESEDVLADGGELASEPADKEPLEQRSDFIAGPDEPSRPMPDIPVLLDQFDRALASFRDGGSAPPRPEPGVADDPLRTFLAREAGTSAQPAAKPVWPFDHQAELRLALDKLARARSKD